ncbi:hypothetical protein LG201_13125 [Methylobacillus gramineus]|uniref:hypothetical protein n=1 Tax=Methylobacillus gramineus TaxID=755169 RepID=UPI001CFFFD95|nr:hypothetical protein [Methylobacillus gramineus]MCB5186150.1 hypothetical protein [Methylobacillus gramineus]
MGTIIGAFLFYFLCLEYPEVVGRLLLLDSITDSPDGNLKELANLDTIKLIFLAMYGLVFCYIASTPILVMHSARMFFNMNDFRLNDVLNEYKNCDKWLNIIKFLIFPIMVSIAAGELILKCKYQSSYLEFITCFFVVSILIEYQILLVYKTISRNSEVYNFYKALSKARDSKSNMIESYRHLREHGNAFAIVICEFFLGALLFQVGKMEGVTISIYAIAVVIWLFPAALVWLSGSAIERRFSCY